MNDSWMGLPPKNDPVYLHGDYSFKCVDCDVKWDDDSNVSQCWSCSVEFNQPLRMNAQERVW